MLFKSENSWFAGISGKGSIFALGILLSHAASAFTFTSIKGGELDNGTIYYAIRTPEGVDPGVAGTFVSGKIGDTTFQVIEAKSSQSSDPSRDEAIQIRVQSDKKFTGDNIVLVVYAGDDETTNRPAPIARVDTNECSDSFCQPGARTGGHWFGVKLTADSLNRGQILFLYPKDICSDLFTEGQSMDACSDDTSETGKTTIVPAVLGDIRTLKLKFRVQNAPSSTELPSSTSTSQEDGTLTLRFQVDRPELVCPSQDTLNNSYFPGDGEIRLNSGVFSGRTAGTTAIASGRAPVSGLIILGDLNSTPSTSTYAGNPAALNASVGISSSELVRGFQNTTSASDPKSYNLTFMIRDRAGLVAPATSACVLSGVQTSEIQGFLKKSNCFIATAAYRSADAAPVILLQEFRDRILLKFGLGRAFVKWYYGWSPRAATWLISNPHYRWPVLIALIPVEFFAWVCLNLWIALLGCAAIWLAVRFRKGVLR